MLVLSASSGAGHVRAAQALEKAIRGRGDCRMEHIDTLTHVSKVFQQLDDQGCISMVRRAPELMGPLYERTDQPWPQPRPRLALDRLHTQPMIWLLEKVQPDLCIATHFLPPRDAGLADCQEKIADTQCNCSDGLRRMWHGRSRPRTWRGSRYRGKNCAEQASR